MPFLFSKRVLATLIAAAVTLLSAVAEGVQLKKVVIDPGHGGHDAGAISLDGKLKEKDVVLDIALRLGDRIKSEYPDVKVIYTRDKDVFIPLDKRADIANKNHADLFISVHANSVPKTSKAPSGCETYVMGMNKNAANMEVCKRENAVILMEDDYTTKYQGFDPNDTESYIFFNLMQNAYFEQSLKFAELCQDELHKGPIAGNRGIKQGGLLVLWRTTMPSVLVELGFITNASDRTTLGQKEKREQLAGNLFDAFCKFKSQYESGGQTTDNKPAEPAAAEKDAKDDSTGVDGGNDRSGDDSNGSDGGGETTASDKTESLAATGNFYAVQIFALSRELESGAPQFKGKKPIHRFREGTVFKYTVGVFETEEEAAAAVTKIAPVFPGCFVVKIDNFEIKKK